MIDTPFLLAPELLATTKGSDPALLLEQLAMLRLENAALRAQNADLQARIRELEARPGQNSSNSSRPPSSDPPLSPAEMPKAAIGPQARRPPLAFLVAAVEAARRGSSPPSLLSTPQGA